MIFDLPVLTGGEVELLEPKDIKLGRVLLWKLSVEELDGEDDLEEEKHSLLTEKYSHKQHQCMLML